MSRRLRIASLVETLHVGGDENRLLSFGRFVDRERFEHRVLMTVAPSEETDRRLGTVLPAFEAAGIDVRLVDSGRIVRRRNLRAQIRSAATGVRVVRRLAKLFRDEEIDVIDARLHYPMALAVLAGRLAGVPVIAGTGYFHGLVLEKPLLTVMGQIAISGLDALISDSQAAIDSYQRWLWRRHPRAVVVANGVAVPTAGHSRAEMRRYFGLPEQPDITVIGQISRVVPHKGHAVLIRAAAPLMRARPDLYLLICGFAEDRAYVNELMQLAGDLGVAERVCIRGYPGPIGDAWTTIDIHAHASLLDSSPIAIHEGMALGLPAVVTDEGGIPELVINGETGLVVPKGDAEAFRTALERMLQQPELARRLGDGARRRYEVRHRPEVMARTLEALFEELVAAKRSLGTQRVATH